MFVMGDSNCYFNWGSELESKEDLYKITNPMIGEAHYIKNTDMVFIYSGISEEWIGIRKNDR